MIPRPSRVLVTNPDRQLPCHFSKTVLRIPSKIGFPFFAPRESGEWIKRWMCVPAFANKIIKSGNSKSGCCYDIPLDVQETISFKQHDCRLNANVCRRSGYTRYVLDPLHFCLSISYSTVVLHFRFLPSLFLSHYTNTESDVTRSPYLLKKFRFS